MHKQNTIPKMISEFPILLLFLFLFALNFLSRGYIFLYIAFVVFLFTSGRKVFADNTGYLGACSYIGENSKIYGKIGEFCSIGSGVRVLQGTHPTTISSKWWEMDLEWLRNHSDLFYDVSSFLQTIANEKRQ